MRQSIRGRVLWHVAALLILVVVLAPFAWMVMASFKSPPEIRGVVSGVLPRSLYAQNYLNLSDTHFFLYLINSLVVAFGATTIALVLAIMAGYGFARFRFRGRRSLLLIVVSMQMFPHVLMAIPLYKIMSGLGLLDARVGLVLVYVTLALPFCVWMLRNYFLNVPIEIEEAAMIDGCSRFGALWRVLLPRALPGIAAAGAFCVILAWEEFLYANTFIDTDSKRTLSVGLASLMGEFTTDWGRLLAAGVLMTIPVVLIFAFLQRYLTQIAGGGVKG